LASEDGTYTPGDTASPELDKLILQAKGLEAGSEERTKVLREAHKEIIEQMAVIPIVTRVNLYAYRDGCILGLHKYVGFGADDWRDVRRGDGCAN
jgi:ABC-type oligopeptide transport system substrate-binding subunit